MINHLKKRIRLTVQIPLILLILVMVGLFLYMNYSNIVSSAISEINRLSSFLDDQTDPSGSQKNTADHLSDNQNGDRSDNEDQNDKEPKKDDHSAPDHSLSADEYTIYEFQIKGSEITYRSAEDPSVADVALSLAHGNEREGVYKGFFYRIQKKSNQDYGVKLLKAEELYQKLRNAFINAVILLILGVILVIALSVFLSNMIIKPVIKNEEKQKAFISDTSHELKTPLAVISVNADMLENEVGKDNKWLGYIQTEVSGMEKLIASLLLLLSSESNEKKGTVAEFDLSVKAEMCVTVFEASAYERGITMKTAIVPDVRFVGCEDDIEHIVAPLVDNAVKHTPKGGNVLFMLTEEKGEAVISVQNEGEPIPEEDREKIFDRFYRVDKARNRSENRYGLGLPIVKSTAEKYGGKVTVKCENGLTTFSVRLRSRHKTS